MGNAATVAVNSSTQFETQSSSSTYNPQRSHQTHHAPQRHHAPRPHNAMQQGRNTEPNYMYSNQRDQTRSHIPQDPGQQYPEIGFRNEVTDPSSQQMQWNDEEWDEKRGMTYMRVLSADEFLGRMDETDEKIRNLSQVEEREMHVGRVNELMGLRAHLQDELLRIEAMLAEDDPELECLREFQLEYPRVVHFLHEIKERQKILPSVTIPLAPESVTLSLVPSASSSMQQSSSTSDSVPATSSTGVASSSMSDLRSTACTHSQSTNTGHSTQDIGIQSSHATATRSQGSSIDENLTEEKLKQIHDQEEMGVNQTFTERMMKGHQGTMSPEELSQVLNDHLLSMQALRHRQNADRDRLNALLEEKKRQRFNKRNDLDQNTDLDTTAVKTSPGSQVQDTPDEKTSTLEHHPASEDGETSSKEEDDDFEDEDFSLIMQRLTTPAHMDYSDDFEDFAEDSEDEQMRQQTLSDDLWSSLRNKLTAEDFHAMMGSYRGQEDDRKKIRQGEADRYKTSLLAKLAKRKKAGAEKDNEEEGEDSKLSSKGLNTSAAQAEITSEELKEKDENFVRTLSRASDGDIEELIKRHLVEVETLRKQRNAEGERLNDKLRDKLRQKRAKHGENYIDVADEEQELEEVEMDLDQLDKDLSAKLIRSRKNLSEDELMEILAKYRKQQESLMRKRAADQDRLNQKLMQKLEEKRKKRKPMEADVSADDEMFFQKFQGIQAEGDLSREAFNDLLQAYLGSKQKPRRPRPSQDQQRADARETASNLVQEHEKATRQRHDIRNREKMVFDSRLQNRLKAKNTNRQREADS